MKLFLETPKIGDASCSRTETCASLRPFWDFYALFLSRDHNAAPSLCLLPTFTPQNSCPKFQHGTLRNGFLPHSFVSSSGESNHPFRCRRHLNRKADRSNPSPFSQDVIQVDRDNSVMPLPKTRVLFLGKESGLCNTLYAEGAGLCTRAAATAGHEGGENVR